MPRTIEHHRQIVGHNGVAAEVIYMDLHTYEPGESQAIRERTGLNEVAGGLGADEFIAKWIPHHSQSGMTPREYPDNYSDVNLPISFMGEIEGPPLDTSLYVLHPDRFTRRPVFHQSTSASLVDTGRMHHLFPGSYFSVMNSSMQNFNLGALVRSILPLSNLVNNGDFVWALDGVVRRDAWNKAAFEILNERNLEEITHAFKEIGRLLSRGKINKGSNSEYTIAVQRLGLGGEWARRLTEGDRLVRLFARDWKRHDEFEVVFELKIEEMKKARGKMPVNLLSFLDEPFPVIYIIDTDKTGNLAAVPRFFADTREQVSQMYGARADKIRLRNPFVHVALPPVEGRRVLAIVIPDEEKSGNRYSIIQRQVENINPNALILGYREFLANPFAPSWRAKSCEPIYSRKGITGKQIENMIRAGILIKVLAPDIYDPEAGSVGDDFGVYTLEEYHPPVAKQVANQRYEEILIGYQIKDSSAAPYATAMF